MTPLIKQIFVGCCILLLTVVTVYPQGPANLSAAYQPEAEGPPPHACSHGGSAPTLSNADQAAFAQPESPSANLAAPVRKDRPHKNGSDYFAGSGTAADPWLIATATDLDNVRHFVGDAHHDKHFRQTANIDLGVSPWNEGEGWLPVGNSIDPFHGHYDGNGYEVMNLVIARDTIEYQGLFGRNNGTIMNLGVVNATVTDNGSRAGILVGLNDEGVIDNCTTSGTIQCDHEQGRIGGLTGWNSSVIRQSSSSANVFTTGSISGGLTGANSGGGTLVDCFATGNVTGNERVGGLAGSNQLESSIVSCHATGEVSGAIRVGGLVGWLGGMSTISDCRAEGKVIASGNWAGGLVGLMQNESKVSGSFSTADVQAGGYSIGGLIGSVESNSSIENAYATGNVSGMDWTGGLVGWFDESNMKESYFSGSVEGEKRVGGVAGAINNGTISNAYSEGKVHGRDDFAGGLGGQILGNSLISGCFSTAHVTGEGNFTGGLAGTLQSGVSVEQSRFTGHVSGKTSTGGLVGWVGESSIHNSFFSGSVEGENRVGGVAGQLRNATIMACYAQGEITSSGNWTGGIAGTSTMSNKVSESFAVVDIHSEGYTVGGLIGSIANKTTIENAWSAGNLVGTNWVGGLVGWADSSSITNAYTANYMYAIQVDVSGGLLNGGAGTQITNAFWNTETTGQEASAGGEGKTNAEMTAQATFAGWDFDNTWAMQENDTYPYLQWQDEPEARNHPAAIYLLTLTASPEQAGTVSSHGMRPEGSLNLISTTANDDYFFVEWTDADGNTFSTDSTTTFSMPGQDLALTATFHSPENTVFISAGDNGQVNPEGEVTVDYDQDLVVTITPNDGFRIAYIRLNGVDIDLENDPGWDAESGMFTVANVVVNQHLEVGFELITYALTFVVTDARTGTEIPDATIRLGDNWHAAGTYFFDQMIPGTYDYLVTREGYFDKAGAASIGDDNLTEAVALDVDDTSLPVTPASRLRLYPNPATGGVRIDTDVSHGTKAVVHIYNLQGQTVYQKPATLQADQPLHLDISNLQPGIYLLALKTHDGLLVERLIIQ